VSTTVKLGRSSLLIAIAFAGLSACNKTPDAGVAQVQGQPANPADGNLAPVDQAPPQNQPVASAPQAAYSQPDQAYAPAPVATDQNYTPDPGYDTASNAQPVYATQPPPPLPEYDQPPAPGDNYIWTPGYWSYGDEGYYWVPGAWVIAPYVDALWTPPYWGYSDGRYLWHTGYWGNYVGFYGGVNYGFGYTGRGYYGGYWNNGRVYYNRSVTNVNGGNVHNVYNYSVTVNNRSRVSYNGGRGGINVRPSPAELAAARGTRMPAVSAQVQQAREASTNRAQFASANGGRPQIAAAPRPLATSYRAPAARPPAEAIRPAAARPAPETRAQLQPTPRPGVAPENKGSETKAPENRVAPQPQQAQRPEYRPVPAAPAPVAQNRPAPQQSQRTEERTVPAARPAAQQPALRPAPTERTQPLARPAPEVRPTPQPAARPAPEARPAPQPAARPAPEARPAPQPAARPVPAARPAPQPAARPAPEARPAPAARPAPKPAPAERPEEKK
jgi:WXXGXW repeat (2 copies)